MAEHTKIAAVVNPLAFLEVDLPWAEFLKRPVDADRILKFLCNPGDGDALDDLVARYKRVSVEEPRLFAAPSEARLLERLIWPLRQSKGAFMLGHYLGALSLCGMVAEMAAILVFDLAGVRLNNAQMDTNAQRALFGSTFEKLGQERRVEVLRAYGLIDEVLKADFDAIRVKRRKYLHLWSADHQQLENDAIECFKSAVRIVVSTLGLSVEDGKLILRPEIFAYLAENAAGPIPVDVPAG